MTLQLSSTPAKPSSPVIAAAPSIAVATTLAGFVAATRHPPLVSSMAAQLVRSVESEHITAAELSRQIASDAVLASHLLRLVNSAFYGMSRRIGTVADALAVLGFNMVRRIVTAVVMQRPVLAHLPDTPATRAFWRHQLLCAALARFVHRRSGADGEEVAYMAGLLHDIGKLAMFVRWPHEFGELLQRPSTSDGSLIADERARFGFDHAQAGGALLHQWNLPEAIVLATAGHADALPPADPLAASVWHANRLAHALVEQPTLIGEPPCLQAAGLDAGARRQILKEVDSFAGKHG